MLLGQGHVFRGQFRVCLSGLRGHGRYQAGLRTIGFKHKINTPWTAFPSLPTQRKSMSGLRRWSLLVLLLGRKGSGEVMEQVREVTRYLLRTVARQSEVHASQKLRRAMQLYSTYSRLWGEEAALNMLASLRRALASKGRHLLLSAVCFSNFNWEHEKISDECLRESAKDLERVTDLCRATIECHTCGKRQVIDQKMVNVDYCMCGGSLGYTDDTREYESWRPFIEREHHVVWRQRHVKHNHLFAYKVYGSYDDVSLTSFMETQINSSYRTEWDDTALQLKVLNTHQHSNSDLVYWLVKFPHFFANRDYLFKRRFIVNSERREVVIMSEAVSPDVLPEEKGVHRVNEYWSTMVIRALGDVDQPGIEYTLTYFDNPGTSLPQSITNFIAVTGFPNYLKKLHTAALQLQSSHEQGEDVYVSLPALLRYPQGWRKGLEEQLQLDVTTREELEVIPQGSDTVPVEDGSIKGLSEEDLPVGSPDEELAVISLPVTSVVVEGSSNEAERHHEIINTQEQLNVTEIPKQSHIEDSSAIDDKTSISSPVEAPKDIVSDKAIHVNIGGKNVSVDLLEAMEVVAPDLEKKSLLVRKIEELNDKLLKDNGKQNAILQKLWKLRHKLRSFQEKASLRKEESLKQMEQLPNRDHYHHMNVDDDTLTQLEVLFDTMRYVLQADKDMRTGKTLLKHSEPQPKPNKEGDTTNRSQPTDDQPPDADNPVNTTNSKTSKKMKKKKKPDKDSQPPSDPPPPDTASGGKWREGETRKDADSMNSEAGYFSNELGDSANSVHNINSEEGVSRSWFTGVSVPYISAWWEAGSRGETTPSAHKSDLTKPEEQTPSELDAQTNTILSQISYILTLRWIFYAESDNPASPSELKNVHVSQDESEGEESESPYEVRWYWYPVNGAYRVYAWVFSASGVNA